MSMIVFNKKLVTEYNQVKQAWNQLLMQREAFNVNQNNITAQYQGALEVNQAAMISKDYWREVDNITTRSEYLRKLPQKGSRFLSARRTPDRNVRPH